MKTEKFNHEEYSQQRIEEAANYLSDFVNPSPEHLMEEFGLDEQTAKVFFEKAMKFGSEKTEEKTKPQFVRKAANYLSDFVNPSPEHLMEEFGLDKQTAEVVFQKAMEFDAKKTKEKKQQKEPKKKAEDVVITEEKEEIVETPEEFSDDQINRYRQAMDTEGFAEYLIAINDSSFNISDIGRVLDLHDAYLVKDSVASNVKNQAFELVKTEVGDIDDGGIDSVTEYINKLSYENPKQVVEMQAKLSDMEQAKERVLALSKELEQELAKIPDGRIVDKRGEYFDRKRSLENSLKSLDFIRGEGILSSYVEERKDVAKKMGISLHHIRVDSVWPLKISFHNPKKEMKAMLEKTELRMAKTDKIEELERTKDELTEQIAQIKGGLTAEVLRLSEVSEKIRNQVLAKMQQMLKTGESLVDIEKAQDLFDKLSKLNGSNLSGIDYLNSDDEAKIQDDIDKAFDNLLGSEILSDVAKISSGKGAFSEVEKALVEYMNKEKIGSKKGDQLRLLIKNTLLKILDDTNLSPLNKLRIQAFLIANKLIKKDEIKK